jgi:hypothetical protein
LRGGATKNWREREINNVAAARQKNWREREINNVKAARQKKLTRTRN